MKKQSSDRLKRRICVTALLVALAVLAAVLALTVHKRAMAAPVYEVKLSGLTAKTPGEAQAQCRAENEKFKDIMHDYSGVCWAWCEDEKLYLVKSSAVTVKTESGFEGFDEISFKDRMGKLHDGYIISIDEAAKELGRIELEPADEYDFELVSMSIREGLRSGEISFADAVYLWEKDSAEVIAVKAGSYELTGEATADFTDDSGIEHACYILDTRI